MTELKNCATCGKVFAMTVRDICAECYQEEEDAFQRVYQFLRKRKNREATIEEITEATNVEEKLVIKFLKQNRLRASQFPQLKYPCEKCSTPISEGRFCYNCVKEIKQEWTTPNDCSKQHHLDESNAAYYSVDYSRDPKKM